MKPNAKQISPNVKDFTLPLRLRIKSSQNRFATIELICTCKTRKCSNREPLILKGCLLSAYTGCACPLITMTPPTIPRSSDTAPASPNARITLLRESLRLLFKPSGLLESNQIKSQTARSDVPIAFLHTHLWLCSQHLSLPLPTDNVFVPLLEALLCLQQELLALADC